MSRIPRRNPAHHLDNTCSTSISPVCASTFRRSTAFLRHLLSVMSPFKHRTPGGDRPSTPLDPLVTDTDSLFIRNEHSHSFRQESDFECHTAYIEDLPSTLTAQSALSLEFRGRTKLLVHCLAVHQDKLTSCFAPLAFLTSSTRPEQLL